MALTNLEPGRDATQASRCNGPEKMVSGSVGVESASVLTFFESVFGENSKGSGARRHRPITSSPNVARRTEGSYITNHQFVSVIRFLLQPSSVALSKQQVFFF